VGTPFPGPWLMGPTSCLLDAWVADGRRFLKINSNCYFGSSQVASYELVEGGYLRPFLM
jgi:hypothetical protein